MQEYEAKCSISCNLPQNDKTRLQYHEANLAQPETNHSPQPSLTSSPEESHPAPEEARLP